MPRPLPTGAAAWTHAFKPASWPKTLVPFALGQAVGVAGAGELSIPGLALGLAFTACDTGFIVLLNDWGDREVDALKRRMYPHAGSPKTIPDGILPAAHVLAGGVVAGLGALAVAAAADVLLGRPGLVALAAAALAVFVAYSFPPLRLNYRGGGELLEAVGVGAVLPAVNTVFQAGAVPPGPLAVALAGYLPLALASAIASGLSDEGSDRAGGKRTFTTWLGNPTARRLADACQRAGGVAWGAAALAAVWLGAPLPWAAGAAAAGVVVLAHQPIVERRGAAAVTHAFAAQGAYKRVLHQAAWRAGWVLSAFLGAGALV